MGFSFGSGKEKGSSSTSQTSRVVLPDYLQNPIEGAVANTQELSLRDYTPYTGQAVAGFSPMQQQAFQGAIDNQGQYNDLFGQASQMISQSGQGLDPNSIQQFMNPYQQNVIDIAKRDALTNYDMQKNELGDQMANVGAFGGSRMAIAESELQHNTGQRLQDLQYQGMADSYNQALGASFQNLDQMNSGGQALANTAMMGQQYNNNDINTLLQAGGMQQANEQAQLSFDLSQFQEGRQWDYDTGQYGVNNLATLGGLTRGEDIGGSSASSSKSSSFGLSFAEGGVIGSGDKVEDSQGFSLKDFLVQKAMARGSQNQQSSGSSSSAQQAQQSAKDSEGSLMKNVLKIMGFAEGGVVDHYDGGGLVDFLGRYAENVGKVSKRKADGATDYFKNQFILTDPTIANYINDVDKRYQELNKQKTDDTILQEAMDLEESQMKPTNDMTDIMKSIIGVNPENLTALEEAMALEETQRATKEPVDALQGMLNEIKDGQSQADSPYRRDTSLELLAAPEKSLSDYVMSGEGDSEESRPSLSPKSAFWADALANSQKGLFGAIGSGLQGYNKEKYLSEEDKYQRKQNEFDQSIKKLNANSTQINSNIAQQNLEFKKRAFPLEQRELAAKIGKLEREATSNPFLKQAIDKYDPAASFGEDPEVVIRKYAETLQKLHEEYSGVSSPQQSQQSLEIGAIMGDGNGNKYKFKGGDPALKENWELL